MAEWTDEWVAALPLRRAVGKPNEKRRLTPREIPDPILSGHRIVIGATSKVFEIQKERPARFGGPNRERKTYKIKIGDAPPVGTMTIELARSIAYKALSLIAQGQDPHSALNAAGQGTGAKTLAAAWQRFKERKGIKSSTLAGYESQWRRNLEPSLGNETLHALCQNPHKAEKLHAEIVAAGRPTDANRSLTLLRAIYLDAARGDPSLPMDRTPTSGLHRRWAEEVQRERHIPMAAMPAWKEQLEKLRITSPIRASFHALCLYLGTRPGELARARWSDIDSVRRVLFLPETKTEPYEIPLTTQALLELDRVREAGMALFPGSHFVFPADSKSGHLERFKEAARKLSHCGNSGRHTFKTIATRLGVADLRSDVLQGRSLLKAGLAGRGYIGRSELTEPLRLDAQRIADEIEQLLTANVLRAAA